MERFGIFSEWISSLAWDERVMIAVSLNVKNLAQIFAIIDRDFKQCPCGGFHH
jgi:hypothetical protein